MSIEILRLGSIVKHGVGGAEASAINFVYSSLLKKAGLDYYSFIFINQVDEELEEFVKIEKREVYINIRYPTNEDFELKTEIERNIIRLEIIHTALLRLAQKNSKISVLKLNEIKAEFFKQNFLFQLEYSEWINKSYANLRAKLFVVPNEKWFDFYIAISEDKREICKTLIYTGRPSDYYIDSLFSNGKWKGKNELIVSGKEKVVEIHVKIDVCEVILVNLTKYDKPPLFEMMKANISVEEREKAYKDWLHSLPPAAAGIISSEPN
jgi:hypothetical protein